MRSQPWTMQNANWIGKIGIAVFAFRWCPPIWRRRHRHIRCGNEWARKADENGIEKRTAAERERTMPSKAVDKNNKEPFTSHAKTMAITICIEMGPLCTEIFGSIDENRFDEKRWLRATDAHKRRKRRRKRNAIRRPLCARQPGMWTRCRGAHSARCAILGRRTLRKYSIYVKWGNFYAICSLLVHECRRQWPGTKHIRDFRFTISGEQCAEAAVGLWFSSFVHNRSSVQTRQSLSFKGSRVTRPCHFRRWRARQFFQELKQITGRTQCHWLQVAIRVALFLIKWFKRYSHKIQSVNWFSIRMNGFACIIGRWKCTFHKIVRLKRLITYQIECHELYRQIGEVKLCAPRKNPRSIVSNLCQDNDFYKCHNIIIVWQKCTRNRAHWA